MALNRQIIKTLDEKEFVTSLIMSDKCCQILLPFVKLSYFEIDYTRIVVSWVLDYFNKFKHSPKNDISSLYRVHCEEIQDEALKELVLNYIQELGKSEIKINNEEYLLDKSKDFLDYRALKEYTENLNACLETKSMDKARKVQQDYKKIVSVELNEADLMDINDKSVIANALSESEEELFSLPEELSRTFGVIHRNDFLSLLAPPKRGKTWLLQYLALQAMKSHLNVIFVSMEMTRSEVIQRLWKTLFGVESGLVKPGLHETARFVEDTSEEGKYRLETFDINVKDGLGKSVDELQKKLRYSNSYTGHLKILAYPAFGASVQDITSRIEELANNGFVADVVVIDYADITKPIGGGSEVRNQLDFIWKHLRSFAMKFHCAVITASQTNRSGMGASVVGGETIGEDFRKIAHVTSLISMEQTPAMRKQHLMRLRNIALRNGESSEDTCVFCQCISLGQFIFGSPISGRNLILEKEDEEDEYDL